MNWKWIIYKMCNDCKKKVEKSIAACGECKQDHFSYKYNCSIDLHDESGTITCIAFDPICQRLFGKNFFNLDQSANEFSVLNEDQIKEIVQGIIG